MFSFHRIVAITIFIAISIFALPQRTLARESAPDVLIEDIEIRGNRRIPRETILYSIQSKPGDAYSEMAVRRDFMAVISMGMFDPISSKLMAVDGPRGGKIVIIEVREYPIIRDIQYRNMKSVSESEVLTRFKERRVGISKETPFDPQ